jgi:hypothetical protein
VNHRRRIRGAPHGAARRPPGFARTKVVRSTSRTTAAAARITGGADVEELAFVVFANAENIQADLVRLLDALEQLAHAIDGTCRGPASSNLAIQFVEIRVLEIGY